MFREHRNLYRMLHVQPEAPEAVIKAAFRALMSTLRMHPDLGGDHDTAARLNAAYETLIDPARRKAYDQSLKRPARGAGNAATAAQRPPGSGAPAGAPAPVPAFNPQAWVAEKRCPFCAQPFAAKPTAQSRCRTCDGPLFPAPAANSSRAEVIGRRHGERFSRHLPGVLRLPGIVGEHTAQLRDLSMSGLSLTSSVRVPRGMALRLSTATFDTVALCVACRASAGGFVVHAQLLILHLQQGTRGVYVSTRA